MRGEGRIAPAAALAPGLVLGLAARGPHAGAGDADEADAATREARINRAIDTGVAWLEEAQRADGSWLDPTCMGPQDVLGTCFALLFLKRTTRPSAAITPSED